MKRAGFPQLKYLQELQRDELPEEARTLLPELETLDFIREGRNAVLYGNPGTGKTHLATALGIKACMDGYSVMFTSVPHLLTQIRECRSQMTLRQLELRFERFDLVVCDEFGYVSFDKEGGELLFNHLSLRAGKRSTIITTNLAFSRWNEVIKDKVLCAALVDRLTHKAFLVNMTGESYRVKETLNLLQVCAELNPNNLHRETAGIEEAMRTFSIHNGLIITENQTETIQTDTGTIEVLPFWKWNIGNL